MTDRPPRVVLTGADLTIADVEAVARRGAAVALDVHARERMAGGARRHRRGSSRTARSSTASRPGSATSPTFDRPGPLGRAPGEPADEPRGGRRAAVPARGRAGDAPAAGQHARPRPLRLPAGRSSTGCSRSSTLGIHPVVPEQGSVGASGDLAPLAHLALPLIGRGEVEFGGRAVPALLALREVGPRAARPRGQGGPRAPQRDPADERDRRAPARRRGPPRPDGERGRGDERRGAARHRRRVRRGLPAGAAASRARSRSPPSCAHLLRDSELQAAITRSAHKVQDPYSLRCVPAGPRRGPRRARPPAPRPRHRAELGDRQPARLPRRRRRRRRRARDRRRAGHQRRQLPRRADRARARLREARARRARRRSASGGPRCSSIRGSTAGCRRSSPRRPGSTPG